MKKVLSLIDEVIAKSNVTPKMMIARVELVEENILRVQEDWAGSEYDAESRELEIIIKSLDTTVFKFIDIATEEGAISFYGDKSREFIVKELRELQTKLREV